MKCLLLILVYLSKNRRKGVSKYSLYFVRSKKKRGGTTL
jgi:hypothetical protein